MRKPSKRNTLRPLALASVLIAGSIGTMTVSARSNVEKTKAQASHADPAAAFYWDGTQARPGAWADPEVIGFRLQDAFLPSRTVLAGLYRNEQVDCGSSLSAEERASFTWVPAPLWRQPLPDFEREYFDLSAPREQLRIRPEGEAVYLDLNHPSVLAILDGVVP